MKTMVLVLLGIFTVAVVFRAFRTHDRKQLHRDLCTYYKPCPECRSRVQEPPSRFDRWDKP